MPIKPAFLDFVADETHQAAERHWTRHGVLPTKVLLFTAEGVPAMVALPVGATFTETERLIAENASNVDAHAIALTSLTLTSTPSTGRQALGHLTLSDLPQPSDDPASGEAVFTIVCWPAGGIVTARVSVIEDASGGDHRLGEAAIERPATLAAGEGLVTWLSALLPPHD